MLRILFEMGGPRSRICSFMQAAHRHPFPRKSPKKQAYLFKVLKQVEPTNNRR